jgi:hypothetical protein
LEERLSSDTFFTAVLEEMKSAWFLFPMPAKRGSEEHPAGEIKKSCTRAIAST